MSDETVRRSKRAKTIPARFGTAAAQDEIEAALGGKLSQQPSDFISKANEYVEAVDRPEQSVPMNLQKTTTPTMEEPLESMQLLTPESVEHERGSSRKRPRQGSNAEVPQDQEKATTIVKNEPVQDVAMLVDEKPDMELDCKSGQGQTGANHVAQQPRTVSGNRSYLGPQQKGYVSVGEPPVWSESRQFLCETLPYYNAYKASAYTYLGLNHGFLLANDPVSGAYIDNEVVITRAAGHLAEDKKLGEMVQKSSHTEDQSSVVCMKNNMDKKVSIVLLVDKNNEQMPAILKHNYSVMDHFQVTDIWADKNGQHVCYRFRLEKIRLNEKSWWAHPSAQLPLERDYSVRAPSKECMTCGEVSKQRYSSWMCTNVICSKFYCLSNGKRPNKALAYHSDFLKERTPWPVEIVPSQQIIPPRFEGNELNPAVAFSKAGWKGVVCPLCGGCTGRIEWDKWICPTPGCGFSHRVNRPIIPAEYLDINPTLHFDGTAIPTHIVDGKLENMDYAIIGHWRVNRYEICPGNFVFHFQANKALNSKPMGPNELFLQLQRDENKGLKRRMVGRQPIKTVGWSQHFAKNYGLPYKYVMAVESHPLNDAPAPICTSLQRMRWAKKAIGSSKDKEFNELLQIGYFEKGKMGYHDDGEDSLGPTIATMSLGAPAEMSIRMKSKYYSDVWNKDKQYDPKAPVIPGCLLEHERLRLNREASTRTPEGLQREFQKVKAASKSNKVLKKEMPALLTMQMQHGDIIIMDGTELQKYYEHSVVPNGGLRFALTCRHILPHKVAKEDHHLGDFDVDAFPEYDGDVAKEDAKYPLF